VPAGQQPDGQSPSGGQDSSVAGTPDAIEPLTRGPVHEGFAEMVQLTPQPTPPVGGQPPQPINEMAADVRPDSPDAEWLSGYWGWDVERKGFIWISGVWRIPPPGARWVPGYWTVGDSGAQRVPGFWQPVDLQQVNYLPAPPAYQSEGVDPGSPPTPDVFWIPGYWGYVNRSYAWQAGYWAHSVPDWMWIAAHYAWTPSGYVFVDGRWDYPLDQRGLLFAPVAFVNPLYQQAGYVYSPASVVDLAMLSQNLFVNPAFQDYVYGDYYGNQFQQAGIYPWYSVGSGAYLYDPVFTYQNWFEGRHDPRWRDQLRQRYNRLVQNPALRPPRTWRDEQRFAHAGNRPGGYRPMVQPVRDVLRNGKGFVKVTDAERREARQNTDVRRQLAAQRGQFERGPDRSPGVRGPAERTPLERKIDRGPQERGTTEGRRPPETRPIERTPANRTPERPLGERPEGRPNMGQPEHTLRLPPARTLAARPGAVGNQRLTNERERIPEAPLVRPNEGARNQPRPNVQERPLEGANGGRGERAQQARPMPPPHRPERAMPARPMPRAATPPARRPTPERKP
jgi:hypothetical protein